MCAIQGQGEIAKRSVFVFLFLPVLVSLFWSVTPERADAVHLTASGEGLVCSPLESTRQKCEKQKNVSRRHPFRRGGAGALRVGG